MILITSPHPDFTKLTLEVCNNYEIKIMIVDATLETSIKPVLDILSKNNLDEEIDAIVSRGGTADILKRVIDLPIITADVTDFDVIKALSTAKEFGNIIGFLGYKGDHILYDFPLISNLLNIEIVQFSYSNTTDIEEQLEKAYAEGIRTMVVGSFIAENTSKKIGFNTVLVRSSRRAVMMAMNRAEEIVYALNRERKISSMLKTIMNLSNDGIISTDNQKKVNFVNLAAESILKVQDKDIIGKNIESTILGKTKTPISLNKPIVGKIERINNNELLMNYFPIKSGHENCGLVINFANIENIQEMEQKIRKQLHEKGFEAQYNFEDIIGTSKRLLQTIFVAKKFGMTDHTVLIRGETGTGKEMFAHSMHNISKRATGSFIAVNCGAFPENLLDSELFGYSEGAFTGAVKGGKTGLIELAHRGTLFLDEIDKMPMNLQVKILRVLQEKEIRPIGSEKVIPVDIRIIAATNRDLLELTKQNEFLRDLYFRINVLNIYIPPLRERKEDILLLMNYFCHKHSFMISIDIFTQDIKEKFIEYSWPGNIRELENLLKRYLTLVSSQGAEIEKSSLKNYFPEFYDLYTPIPKNDIYDDRYIKILPGSYKQMKYQIICQLYEQFGKNKSRLANYLGISRNTLTQIINECYKNMHCNTNEQ